MYNSGRLAYCDNKNCYLQLRFFKKTRWQYFNYNASIPKLDQITVGYVPVTGFSLDDYDYDYDYNDDDYDYNDDDYSYDDDDEL